MRINESLVEQYEKEKSEVLNEAIQETASKLKPFCNVITGLTGDYYVEPFEGDAELDYRRQRYEDFKPTEMSYASRGMRSNLFQGSKRMSTDDPLFLNHFPANLTRMAKQLGHAAERVYDRVILGTRIDNAAGSATKGQSLIMQEGDIWDDAEDGSPYGGVTGGILGDNYAGRSGTQKLALPQQPVLIGSETPITGYLTNFTSPRSLDMELTNVIPANYVEDGDTVLSGLTIAKLRAVRRCFEERKIDGNEILNIAITPEQKWDLMKDAQLQSALSGYTTIKTGFMDDLYGIRFIVTKNTPLVNIGTAADPKWVRACPVWRTKDVTLGVWANPEIHIRQKPGLSIDELVVGCTCGFGAYRKYDELVLSVHCDEGRFSA